MSAICECCGETLEHLDTITHKVERWSFDLYICHNEDCDQFGAIYNDRIGYLRLGDPSGLY
jgi:hypothetical protein